MTFLSIAWLRGRLSSSRAEPCSTALAIASAETTADTPEAAAEFGLNRPAEWILEVNDDKCNSSRGSSTSECADGELSAALASTASKKKYVQQHVQQRQHVDTASGAGAEEKADACGAVGVRNSFFVDGRRRSAQKQGKDPAENAAAACSSSSLSGSYARSSLRLLQLPQQLSRRNSSSTSWELAEMWKVPGGEEGTFRQRSESFCCSNSNVSGGVMKPTLRGFCNTGWSEEQRKAMILVNLLQQQSEAALSMRARKREKLLNSSKGCTSEEATARTGCTSRNIGVDSSHLQQHHCSVAAAEGRSTGVRCFCSSCLGNNSTRRVSLRRLQQPLERSRSGSSRSSSFSDTFSDLILPISKRRKGLFEKMREALRAHGTKVNPLNLIRFSERIRRQVGTRFFLMLISVFAGVRGVLYGLSHKALLPFLKELGQDAGTYQSIDALGTVIWGMMGMIGALSDAVPLGGYQKRYYMLVANVLGVGGVALLAFSPVGVMQNNIWLVGIGTFLLCMQTSTLVLMCSGKYSEMMEKRPEEMKSDVVTFVFTCWMVGNLVGSALVGPISDKVGSRPLYYIALPLAAQSLLPIFLGFLPEEKQRMRLLRSKLWGHKKFFVMAAAVGVAATGVVVLTILDAGGKGFSSTSTNQQQQVVTEEKVSYWMASYCGIASVCLIGLCLWCLPQALAKCNLYLFLWGLVNVSISGALDFFYTAPASCLADGPHFDYTYYATLTAVVGTAASWSGIWVFHAFLGNWTFRHVFWLTIAVRALAALFDCAIILRINVRYLGISDKFAYLFGDAIVLHLVNTLNHMPGYILTARLCPKGLESTAYALTDGMSHLGWNFSKHLGVLATRLAGITTVQTPQKACNFDRLPLLALVTQVALPLIAIPLSFLLLPNQSMSKSIQKDYQVNHTKQSGVEGGGGSAAVLVVKKNQRDLVTENEQLQNSPKTPLHSSVGEERKTGQEDADVELVMKDCETGLKRDENITGHFDRNSGGGDGDGGFGGFGVDTRHVKGEREIVEGSSDYIRESADVALKGLINSVGSVKTKSCPRDLAENDLYRDHVGCERKEEESKDKRLHEKRMVFRLGETEGDAGLNTRDKFFFNGDAQKDRYEMSTGKMSLSEETDLLKTCCFGQERSSSHGTPSAEKEARRTQRNVHSWREAFSDEDILFKMKQSPTREVNSAADNALPAKNRSLGKDGFPGLTVNPANGENTQCFSADEKSFKSLPLQQLERRQHQQHTDQASEKLKSHQPSAKKTSMAFRRHLQHQQVQLQRQRRKPGEQKQALLLQHWSRSSETEGREGENSATDAKELLEQVQVEPAATRRPQQLLLLAKSAKQTMEERRQVENYSLNDPSFFVDKNFAEKKSKESPVLPTNKTATSAAGDPSPTDQHIFFAVGQQSALNSSSNSSKRREATKAEGRNEQQLLKAPPRAFVFMKKGVETQLQQLRTAQRRSLAAAEIVRGAAAAARVVGWRKGGGNKCAVCNEAATSSAGGIDGGVVCGGSEVTTRRDRDSGTRDRGYRGARAPEHFSPVVVPSPILRRSPSGISALSSSLSKSTAAETSHSRQQQNMQPRFAAATTAVSAAAAVASDSSRSCMLALPNLRFSESTTAAASAATEHHQYGQQQIVGGSPSPSAYIASLVFQQQQQQRESQLQDQKQQQKRWVRRMLSALLQRRSSSNCLQRTAATTAEETVSVIFSPSTGAGKSKMSPNHQAANAEGRTATATLYFSPAFMPAHAAAQTNNKSTQ